MKLKAIRYFFAAPEPYPAKFEPVSNKYQTNIEQIFEKDIDKRTNVLYNTNIEQIFGFDYIYGGREP